MAKTHAVITERFERDEPREVEGVVIGHIRVGSAKIIRGGKHIATLQVGIETHEDDDEETRLAIVLVPAEPLGYDAAVHLDVQGDVAVKLAELLRVAEPYLNPKSMDRLTRTFEPVP